MDEHYPDGLPLDGDCPSYPLSFDSGWATKVDPIMTGIETIIETALARKVTQRTLSDPQKSSGGSTFPGGESSSGSCPDSGSQSQHQPLPAAGPDPTVSHPQQSRMSGNVVTLGLRQSELKREFDYEPSQPQSNLIISLPTTSPSSHCMSEEDKVTFIPIACISATEHVWYGEEIENPCATRNNDAKSCPPLTPPASLTFDGTRSDDGTPTSGINNDDWNSFSSKSQTCTCYRVVDDSSSTCPQSPSAWSSPHFPTPVSHLKSENSPTVSPMPSPSPYPDLPDSRGGSHNPMFGHGVKSYGSIGSFSSQNWSVADGGELGSSNSDQLRAFGTLQNSGQVPSQTQPYAQSHAHPQAIQHSQDTVPLALLPNHPASSTFSGGAATALPAESLPYPGKILREDDGSGNPDAIVSLTTSPSPENIVKPHRSHSPRDNAPQPSHSDATSPGHFEASKSSTDPSGATKDDKPYSRLIFRALLEHPKHAMELQEIYRWFEENTDKPTKSAEGWKNSIRHNLSMNAAFTKANPAALSSTADEVLASSKRTPIWFLTPEAIREGVQSTTRYRKGKHGHDHHAPGFSRVEKLGNGSNTTFSSQQGTSQGSHDLTTFSPLSPIRAASGRRGGVVRCSARRSRSDSKTLQSTSAHLPQSAKASLGPNSRYNTRSGSGSVDRGVNFPRPPPLAKHPLGLMHHTPNHNPHSTGPTLLIGSSGRFSHHDPYHYEGTREPQYRFNNTAENNVDISMLDAPQQLPVAGSSLVGGPAPGPPTPPTMDMDPNLQHLHHTTGRSASYHAANMKGEMTPASSLSPVTDPRLLPSTTPAQPQVDYSIAAAAATMMVMQRPYTLDNVVDAYGSGGVGYQTAHHHHHHPVDTTSSSSGVGGAASMLNARAAINQAGSLSNMPLFAEPNDMAVEMESLHMSGGLAAAANQTAAQSISNHLDGYSHGHGQQPAAQPSSSSSSSSQQHHHRHQR